jgi:phage shock protein PspC (stress-responsive transcriptional regulator)
MIGGVAAGVADYLDLDPMMVRIAWVVLVFVGGLALPLYAAAWLLIPEEDSETSIAEDLFHHFAGA